MRVAVVFFGGKNRSKTAGIAKALANGIEAKGHHVDIIDGDHDVNTKLTIYQYVAVGTSAINTFGGKIPDVMKRFLASSGSMAGKRSFAFAVKGGMRQYKTLTKIMESMEHEGMYLKYSEVLSSATEAEAIGKRLHIE
jgi:flavodoxin